MHPRHNSGLNVSKDNFLRMYQNLKIEDERPGYRQHCTFRSNHPSVLPQGTFSSPENGRGEWEWWKKYLICTDPGTGAFGV